MNNYAGILVFVISGVDCLYTCLSASFLDNAQVEKWYSAYTFFEELH